MLLGPGETVRVMCTQCQIEFDLTLEPKAKGSPEAKKMSTESFEFCPFCGEEDLEIQ